MKCVRGLKADKLVGGDEVVKTEKHSGLSNIITIVIYYWDG